MKNQVEDVRQSRFPKYLFWLILIILLCTGGVHQGLVIGLASLEWDPIIQVHIILAFWIGVAVFLAYLIMRIIRKTYDDPLAEISEATKRIARGDFSVRVMPTHIKDDMDFLDIMAEDVNTMAEELGSIETLKTDFISNVSHELKTPLSVINNYGTLLCLEEIADGDRIEYATAISGASKRMSELITNILRLNRLENQRLDAKKEQFDLSAQLGECILGFENIWEEKNIDLEIDMPDELTISSDEELLSLVWNNLLSNAFKFTEPGGTVGVTLRQEDGDVLVTVRDTGCGMDEKTKQHIFDKFYQGDTSRATQGNGLGLALVKRVMDLIGGEIKVTSTVGEGSVFSVRIPIG